ncbi:glycoside hydrolase family 64 protein [Acrodontium crateriforme]|uniref:Glycoside hydrolase family 64 protein n=1 Tax=Acrodontium crateriforme TaxID=150365 RepID=A0AAQ3MDJ7_9PEZI|nr:glycoside hydrolase family 64 protein [Acrodontium crateriforme]
MLGIFTSLLAATTFLFGEASAAPPIDVRSLNVTGFTPVQPGGAKDIIVTKDNTLNATQASDNGIHRAVVPRLCAAFHRATILLNGGNVQPSLPASSYYTVNPTNYYNLFVHQNEADGRGYAFSYDDVNPSTGGPDQSGVLVNMNAQLLQISVGGA